VEYATRRQRRYNGPVPGAYAHELIWAGGLFVAVVVVAALVNRFRPSQRSRVRRLVRVLALYVIAILASLGFALGHLPTWAESCQIAADVLQAFTLVSVAATLVFSLGLPGLGLELPLIASDLVVGLGYVVVSITVLSRNGVNPTSALVSGAAVSAVLAISLQSTLGNVIGGVALQLDGSIHEGDWLQLDNGKVGKVRAVRWRHTVLETRDWSTIIVPNAQLLASSFTILGKRDDRAVPQRLWVWFNVDFRFAPSEVVRVVGDAITASPIDNVADDPPPSVVCMDLARDGRDSVATYAVRYWIRDLASDDPTSGRVRARIYTALQRAQIPLAVPAHTAFVELKDEARTTRRDLRHFEAQLVALKTVHLFRTLTDEELRLLAAGMHHVTYTAGEVITRQGGTAHWLYVLTAGAAEIRVDPNRAAADDAAEPPGGPIVVATIHAPDFFGEMSLMTGEPRSADVVAIGDVACYRLGKDTFKTVLLARPAIASELSEKLAERRVELIAAREHLDATARRDRAERERDRILGGIKAFFALDD
jgi:small-conductance mechanosensitive channel/CRP-like cAMP-binding protein